MSNIKKFFSHMMGEADSIEDLRKIIKNARVRGIMSEGLYSIIDMIFEVSDTQIGEIMVPRVDMIYVKENMTLDEAVQTYRKWGYSKLPIIRERIDNVVGILYIKEVLRHIDSLKTTKVKDIGIEPHFIPDSKRVIDTLRELQKKHASIGMVVDEFGSVVGVITLEDLIEEIVGEIYEEFDREEFTYKKERDGIYLFNSKIELDDVSKLLKHTFESEEVSTLGGLLMERFNKVPQKGEKLELEGFEFEIVDATKQRIKRIRARRLSKNEEIQSNGKNNAERGHT